MATHALPRCAIGAICAMAFVIGIAPHDAFAQAGASTKPKRVAMPLGPSTAPDPIGPTRKAWAELFAKQGLVDGRDIEIAIYRGKSSDWDDWAPVARQVVESRPDVIVTPMMAALPYLRRETQAIPIVTFVNEGLLEDHADSLRRPGTNVTGMAPIEVADLFGQRMQLVKEVRPGARRLAFVWERLVEGRAPDWARRIQRTAAPRLRELGRSFGMEVTFIEVEWGSPAVAATIVTEVQKARVDAVFLPCQVVPEAGPEFWERLAAMGLVVATDCRKGVRDGALLAGWSDLNVHENLARIAARIVRGEKASEIPLERARGGGNGVNLRTAKALGITLPASILLRATEVFD